MQKSLLAANISHILRRPPTYPRRYTYPSLGTATLDVYHKQLQIFMSE